METTTLNTAETLVHEAEQMLALLDDENTDNHQLDESEDRLRAAMTGFRHNQIEFPGDKRQAAIEISHGIYDGFALQESDPAIIQKGEDIATRLRFAINAFHAA